MVVMLRLQQSEFSRILSSPASWFLAAIAISHREIVENSVQSDVIQVVSEPAFLKIVKKVLNEPKIREALSERRLLVEAGRVLREEKRSEIFASAFSAYKEVQDRA